MVPIILDASVLPMALIGRGASLEARLRWLADGSARRLTVFTDASLPDGIAGSARVIARDPDDAELAACEVVWITGLPVETAREIATRSRRLGALVNVEDVRELCDFHTPAVVRRGDLLLTVSTGGRSPGLAARIRGQLDVQFGPEWTERLDVLATKRAAWRRRQRSLPELAGLTDAVIDHQGWLAEETHW